MSNAFDKVNDSKNKFMKERIVLLLQRNGRRISEHLDEAMQVDMLRALVYTHVQPFAAGDKPVLKAWKETDVEIQNEILIEAFR